MYPKYFEYSYGIDAPKSLEKLLDEGYAVLDSAMDSLEHTTIAELKLLLKEKGVKGISKMKKDDVHNAIKENYTEGELEKLISIKGYSLSEKGRKALENNQEVIDRHPKKKL